jgi:predicted protein tyrosine phosphatase
VEGKRSVRADGLATFVSRCVNFARAQLVEAAEAQRKTGALLTKPDEPVLLDMQEFADICGPRVLDAFLAEACKGGKGRWKWHGLERLDRGERCEINRESTSTVTASLADRRRMLDNPALSAQAKAKKGKSARWSDLSDADEDIVPAGSASSGSGWSPWWGTPWTWVAPREWEAASDAHGWLEHSRGWPTGSASSANWTPSPWRGYPVHHGPAELLVQQMDAQLPPFKVWERQWDYMSERYTPVRNENPLVKQPCEPYNNLLLGDLDDAQSPLKMRQLGVKTVIALCKERLPQEDEDHMREQHKLLHIKTIIVDAQDTDDYDILKHLQTVEFAVDGGRTLVCCWAGVNRSAALVVGYMLRMGMDLLEAFKAVQHTRGEILTNSHFRRLLAEEHLRLVALRGLSG